MVTIITALATILLCGLVGHLARAIRHRAEREIELSEQRRELVAINNRLQVDVALRREAEQLRRDGAQLTAQRDQLQADLARIRGLWPVRFSAPLRRILRALRGRKKAA